MDTETKPQTHKWVQRLYIYDQALYNRLKAQAALQQKSLQGLTEEIIRAYVDQAEGRKG